MAAQPVDKLASELLQLQSLRAFAHESRFPCGAKAYHRQRDPQSISANFVFIATRLLLYAMFPLIIALGLEFFLIARVITNSLALSIVLAIVLLGIFSTLWFLLPRNRTLQGFLTG
jgi:uncharacterized membrane protein